MFYKRKVIRLLLSKYYVIMKGNIASITDHSKLICEVPVNLRGLAITGRVVVCKEHSGSFTIFSKGND